MFFLLFSIIFFNIYSKRICAGQNATLIVFGADDFYWINGPQAQSYVVTPSGTSTYTVFGSIILTGCSSNAIAQVTVDLCENIDANPNKNKFFDVFPNPCKDKFCITNQIDSPNLESHLIDGLGKIIQVDKIFKGINWINCNNLSKGLYYLELKQEGNTIGRNKLLID